MKGKKKVIKKWESFKIHAADLKIAMDYKKLTGIPVATYIGTLLRHDEKKRLNKIIE